MPFSRIARYFINRAERRIGVRFDYVHEIARADLGLLSRYNTIVRSIDRNTKVPRAAYHVARLRAALSADCGTCVAAEIALASKAGVDAATVDRILAADYANLPPEMSAVALLTDAVTGRREDDPEARALVRRAYGDAGLIEIALAMNGAALLPGVKRAMGHAAACDLTILRKLTRPTP